MFFLSFVMNLAYYKMKKKADIHLHVLLWLKFYTDIVDNQTLNAVFFSTYELKMYEALLHFHSKLKLD